MKTVTVQADVLQADAETVVAEWPAGASAGEQPWGGSGASDGGVAAAGGQEFTDEVGEGPGEDDWAAAETDLDGVSVVVAVVGGEFDDVGDALGVEE